jgi:sporulation-control protein spo0M
LLVELREYSFSKSILDSFEVYFREACEDAVLPVSVSEEPVKVWMVVKRFTRCLYGENSGELTSVDTEHVRERTPGSPKEDGVELAVVLEESP